MESYNMDTKEVISVLMRELQMERISSPKSEFSAMRIGALYRAIEALERDIPINPIIEQIIMDDKNINVYFCPRCHKPVRQELINHQPRCSDCGQSIEW